MKKFLTGLLLLLTSSALAAPPVIWGPNNKAQFLNSGGLLLNATGPSVLFGSADPTSVAPATAAAGSLYLRSNGSIYKKTDAGVSTNWTELAGGGSGVTTMTAVGSAPNANGATISGSDLTLQPADGTNPGVLTSGAQTIGGAKTFSGGVVAALTGNASTASALAADPADCAAGTFAQSIVAAGTLTCAIPQSSQTTRSERYGASASANATDSTAVGNLAVCDSATSTCLGSASTSTGASGTAVGYNATAILNSVAIGRGATVSSTGTGAVGYGTTASAVRAFAVGQSATASADAALAIGVTPVCGHQASICMGFGATSTAANQLVIGGDTRGISDVYIGESITNATPLNLSIQPTGASGSDVAGSTFTIAGSKGTGNATPGTIVFQTSTAGASGSTLQTLATRATINTNGINSKSFYFTEYDAGNSGAAITVDWTNGSLQKVTMTGNCTFTLSNPVAGTTYVLKLVQDGTGARTYTWPAAVLWPGGVAPTGSGASKTDVVSLLWDGTSYYGTFNGNY